MIAQQNYMPEKYLIQHPAIDMQHELLFVLYNEVLHSLESSHDCYDLADIFLSLSMYVNNHFQFEEDLMQATNYSDHEAHFTEHRNLKNNVTLLHTQFLNAKNQHEEQIVAQEIASFLYNWLEHHIAEVDRALSHHLNAKQNIQ